MSLDTVSETRCFGGRQLTFKHDSAATGTPMRVAVYLPPQAARGPVPVLLVPGRPHLHGGQLHPEGRAPSASPPSSAWPSIAPDTSPRGDAVPDDDAYDFGEGAGFYLDATEAPWSTHFRMRRYIEEELPALLGAELPLDLARQGLSGHSMGGHGALTIGLRHPGRFRAVSAFAPIASPIACPWGEKALSRYLGPDRAAWRPYDACALIADGARLPEILVDQGTADPFLEHQLKPELLEQACRNAGIPLTLNRRAGYDHSYFFIASFIADHLRWHGERLAQ